ncbi:MAG: FKBP-type peptidyl-prolyl cis-trans isomerase [Fuerstiella sp.]
MRLLSVLSLSLLVPITAAADEKASDPAPQKFETARDKASYGIGLNIGRQFKQQGLDVDPKIVAAGIAAILEGKEPAVTDAELRAAFEEMQKEQQQKQQAAAEENKKAAVKFLTENATKEGVKQTRSGLQYQVIREGEGDSPTDRSQVSTHYRGKLLDGTVFDQSYEGKEPTAGDKPISFGVTQVIDGWTEALKLMKPGARYRLFIPPELAYGESGRPSIPPNSLLIFDIELVSVK